MTTLTAAFLKTNGFLQGMFWTPASATLAVQTVNSATKARARVTGAESGERTECVDHRQPPATSGPFNAPWY